MKKQPLSLIPYPLSMILIATIVISGAITTHGQTQIDAFDGDLRAHDKSFIRGLLKPPARFPT
jgi:hypothetical protein